jgi:excinuclease ABC subunit C
MTEEKQATVFDPAEYPASPGVYLMKDARGRIIYVGKAKSLRKRIASYFGPALERAAPKTRTMVSKIDSIETLTTATEKEALLLEASLIKKHRPRYNVVLRDDKQYVLFKLNKGHPFPRLTLTRRVVRDGSAYFGPFTSAAAARETMKAAGRLFPLRKCADTAFKNRVRPCLYYHIKECPAPCVYELPEGHYEELVKRTELLLSGRSGELTRLLTKQMKRHSELLEFERAAELRDRIKAVRATVERQAAVLDKPRDLDVVAPVEVKGGLALGLLFVRRGRLTDKKTFHWPGLDPEDAPEAVSGFLNQFYTGSRLIPDRIVTPWEPDDPALAEAVSERRGAAVTIAAPSSGVEKKLLEMARANAREHAVRSASEDAGAMALRLARALKLSAEASRIECVDVSHLGGRGARVGMVVFEDGVPAKDQYRNYAFPELEGSGDDYAALAGWAARRAESGPPWPDLVLVDGGRGQLAAVERSLQENGAAGLFDLAAIAKTPGPAGTPDRRAGALEDRVFRPGRKNPVNLRPGSPEMLFLQRVRDEAHRFALGRQRAARTKHVLGSELMSLPGIGPKTARLLWDAFGSLRAMREAGEADIARIQGIGPKRAARIHAALKTL